jgi:hypothetical protein
MTEEQEKYRELKQPSFKFCPLFQEWCREDRCAWWVTYLAGTEHEYSECAIASLARLNDISLMR